VAPREEADDHALEDVLLSDDHPPDFGQDLLDGRAFALDPILN
jgi:hypothetical protein